MLILIYILSSQVMFGRSSRASGGDNDNWPGSASGFTDVDSSEEDSVPFSGRASLGSERASATGGVPSGSERGERRERREKARRKLWEQEQLFLSSSRGLAPQPMAGEEGEKRKGGKGKGVVEVPVDGEPRDGKVDNGQTAETPVESTTVGGAPPSAKGQGGAPAAPPAKGGAAPPAKGKGGAPAAPPAKGGAAPPAKGKGGAPAAPPAKGGAPVAAPAKGKGGAPAAPPAKGGAPPAPPAKGGAPAAPPAKGGAPAAPPGKGAGSPPPVSSKKGSKDTTPSPKKQRGPNKTEIQVEDGVRLRPLFWNRTQHVDLDDPTDRESLWGKIHLRAELGHVRPMIGVQAAAVLFAEAAATGAAKRFEKQDEKVEDGILRPISRKAVTCWDDKYRRWLDFIRHEWKDLEELYQFFRTLGLSKKRW